ncbi:hypothetical protein FHR32_001516 [Streptosporangium album]|uniref:Uncharacterized protein n=1 Tax=Streptosporangium album TaxID=47479 RepID=A0A7W7RTI7_9ACTN|nr:hypothetical protein [Streptosporangium album]MBB4937211.1 hypothetical protein [Streptosporangium album]
MRNVHEPLHRLARVHDGELTDQASAAGAQALLASIVSGPGATTTAVTAPAPRRLRMPRLAVGALAAGVLVAGVIVGPGVLGSGSATSYANSAIAIERDGDQYVARIKDPFADHERYTEAFHAVGLNVDLRSVPVSPGSVGKILGMMITGKDALDPAPDPSGPRSDGVLLSAGTVPENCHPGRDSGCVMVMRVPAAFTGDVNVRLGRQARPEEEYANFDLAMAPGEMFDGVRLRDGRPVRDVLTEARRRDLTTVFSLIKVDEKTGGLSFEPLPADRVKAGWTVWNAWQVKAGVIRLLVTPERLPENPFHNGSAPPPAS